MGWKRGMFGMLRRCSVHTFAMMCSPIKSKPVNRSDSMHLTPSGTLSCGLHDADPFRTREPVVQGVWAG